MDDFRLPPIPVWLSVKNAAALCDTSEEGFRHWLRSARRSHAGLVVKMGSRIRINYYALREAMQPEVKGPLS